VPRLPAWCGNSFVQLIPAVPPGVLAVEQPAWEMTISRILPIRRQPLSDASDEGCPWSLWPGLTSVIKHCSTRLDMPRARRAYYRQVISGVAAPDPGSGQVLIPGGELSEQC